MNPDRVLLKGAEAIAEAAVRAGCRHFFGYPITPQNEIPEYMARRLPPLGGVYLQAESEVAAINMLYGAGATGTRVMTSSSSPGLSLMSEGASYLVGAELPAVVVNVMRGGPGLGDIAPAQADWAMHTRGWGHGDKRYLSLAPATVQEAVELTGLAFDLAERYRNPVVVLADGLLGQMMEPVTLPPFRDPPPVPEWAARGKPSTRARIIVRSLYLDPEQLEQHVEHLFGKFKQMERDEQRWETWQCEDRPTVVVCAFGTVARIARTAITQLREQGIAVGLFRPITAWPFAAAPLKALADHATAFLCVEMNRGQLLEDVRATLADRRPVAFFGRDGGVVPTVEEIVARVKALVREAAS